MQRRIMLASSGLTMALLLTGCGGSTSPVPVVTFDQAKAYMDVAVAAVTAAAQQYLVGPPVPTAANAVLVNTVISKLGTVKTALDQVTLATDWKSGALEAITLMQQLSPTVAPFLGGAAPYVPLALAVIQAFVMSLPPPASAPVTPPAPLAQKALEKHP